VVGLDPALGALTFRRKPSRGIRSVLAASLGPVLAAGGMALPPAAVTAAAVAGTAAVAAAGVAAAPAAKAATPPGKALVLLQNGEATAPETTALQAAGWSVTQATPAQWLADSASTFKSYAVLVIGDPSTTSSCSTLTPTTATSGTDAIGTTWQSAVTGNVAVLGTAPAAGTTASNLVDDSVGYAASGYLSSAGTGTGLYVSLNCEYKTAAAKTAVPLLSGVQGIGAAGGLTVQGSLSCGDPGTVNKWEAAAAGTFGAVTNGSLGTGSWTSPGCPVQEAFNSWPAMFTPVAFDAASDVTADFTASDGVSGQPYMLLGQPVSAATTALAPGAGGEVLAGTTAGSGNAAAPGVVQATTADPVNTESGDFTQSSADFSVPGFGPALDFTRTYDAQAARRQTVAGTPGPLGYGWTDNWATSLTLQRPVPGDIYTLNPTGVFPFEPVDMVSDAAGDVFYADATANDVVEVAAASHTQFGISMTAGQAYVVAGSSSGASGHSGDGGPATSALLNEPWSLTLDGSGNLFIADMLNNRVQEVPAASGTQFGIAMTANDMYTVAGSASGTAGSSGDGGPAASARLNNPASVRTDGAGNLYISDSQNFRVQEVPVATGTQRGQSMTAGDMYTIAGKAGTSQYSGDGGPATSARFISPSGMTLDAAGDLYIADDYVNVVREIPAVTGTQWGEAMTASDIYPIAGSSSVAGTGGSAGDGGPATSADLNGPGGVVTDTAGDLYISDVSNNRLQEVPVASGTQWGQSMTAGDMYTVIGSSMTAGDTGDGGPATAAEINSPGPVTFDTSGSMLVPDPIDSKMREVFATTSQQFSTSPAGTGITVNQADGSKVTFYPKSGGACTAPYVAASGSTYCTLPQNVNAALTDSSSAGTYTYTPMPGTSYTYSASTGTLVSESDAAGDTLAVRAGSPSPGSGNCPSTASSCTTITAASGRSLVLGSNSGGLVASVTDPAGRRWAYAYNSASQLVSATDPMGNVTSYTYGAGATGNPQLASDLLTITGPNAQPGGPDAGDSTVNVYDSLGRVSSQTDPIGYQTTFSYCANAATGDCMNPATGTGIVTVTDPDGNSTVYFYQQGTLAATSAFTGTTLTSETDKQPNTTSGTLLDATSTDGDGNQTTFTYDTTGDLTSSTDPSGITTTSTYTAPDESNCNTLGAASAACSSDTPPAAVAPGGVISAPASAPPKGVTYTLHDTAGNALYTDTGVYQPGSSTAAYQQVTYTLYKGNSVTVGGTAVSCAAIPPSQSLPCAKINADGVVTQLTYNSAGDLTSSSAPDGNGSEVAITSYAYDGDGEQTSQTLPDGNLSGADAGNYTTVTAYNADGRKTSVSAGAGSGATVTARTTTYGYDADGNQISVKNPRGYTTTTAYTADDKPALVTDPDGHATLTCYDGAGNTAQTVPATGVAANGLTAASCPASYPAGYTVRLASDAITTTYDAAGQKTIQTAPAPAGQSGTETTRYTYDSAGRTTKVAAPPASGASGAPGNVTIETYAPDGAIATLTAGYGTPTATTTVYCYDSEGNRTAVIPGDGNTAAIAACSSSSPFATTYAYDSAGEKVSQVTPHTGANPAGGTTTWTYDPAGNPLTMTDPAGVTTTYTYSLAGKEATVSYSGSAAHSITLGYDADGGKVSMADATGTTANTYDPFGELTSATNGHGQTVAYAYDADGNTTGITYPLPSSATWARTATVDYAYDNADNLTAVTDFAGNAIGVTSNADGLTTKRTLGTTGDTITTGYDNSNRASSISLANSSGTTLQSFTYGDAPDGSILTETDSPASAGTSKTYAYTAQDQLSSEANSGTDGYAYDASGSLTGLPGNATGSYDDAGELINSTSSPGTATSYTYNADGQRTGATTGGAAIEAAGWNGAGELTSYTGSADTLTAASYDGDGLRAATTDSAGTQYYTWDTVPSTPELLMDGSNAYIYGTGGSPAEQVNLSSGTASYLLTDSLGSIRGTVSATGALTGSATYDAYGNPLTPGGLTATTPFGYAGYYTEGTGLDYLVTRYYDPATGQFISVDPQASTTNAPYAYATGNPATYTDPNGQSAVNCNWWGGFGFSKWGVNIRIPAGQLCSQIIGSGRWVYSVRADFEAAYVISAFSYEYRFAHTNRSVYWTFWSDHYNASSITNGDSYHYPDRYLWDGPFWTTFWVDWRARNTVTTTSNIIG
jgi:RHS repeat-associated protein